MQYIILSNLTSSNLHNTSTNNIRTLTINLWTEIVCPIPHPVGVIANFFHSAKVSSASLKQLLPNHWHRFHYKRTGKKFMWKRRSDLPRAFVGQAKFHPPQHIIVVSDNFINITLCPILPISIHPFQKLNTQHKLWTRSSSTFWIHLRPATVSQIRNPKFVNDQFVSCINWILHVVSAAKCW